MKIRYPIITIIVLIIAQIVIGNLHPYPVWFDTASAIIFVLIVSCLGLIAYLAIRNIFRAIKGAAAGAPKQKQDTTPPWEK